MRHQIKALQLLLLLLTSITLSAQQVCTGALGDPVINIDFGSGNTNFSTPLSANTTNYRFIAGTPGDGDYTIAKNTNGMRPGWHQVTNHTSGELNGYMMVVNASNTPGIFYQTAIPNLCPGTTYEFAAWIINLLNYSGIKPNITFSIETSAGTVLKTYNTGDIPDGSSPNWVQYATTFTTTGQTDLILKITNNGPGGNGNDIALDDITFRACGPIITPSINNGSANISVCEGTTGSYNLSADVSAGYADPVFQWQVYTGTSWTDIPGQNSKQTTVNLNNAAKGTYQYRLVAAEKQNIGSINCRVASSPLIITVNAKPNTLASNNGPVCIGANIQLSANEGTTFTWTGPNGFTSTDKSPLINNAQLNMSGVYTVTATLNGCTNTASTTVQVLDPVEASTSFNSVSTCESSPVQLFASGGTTYKWLPVDGLSDPNISNPLASPKESTTYTVTVSNGACSATATVAVNIIKNAVADAGTDFKILNGRSVTLNGKVTGDNVTYFWTPVDYLDDPTKLNPIANPPFDITYTLHAESNSGCLSSTDDVFVKVYPKIVIPNSFTPNGDGVNDTWIIPATDAFPNTKVRIVNRTGSLLYQSNGIYNPWDGKFEGKDLPVGTYYYTIYFNEDFEVFSGWVFLTR
ncbi:gliding motility-associated C-terminal domain-containing protein [Pedobacter rhodius]|uniref:Gliding motility-associated C-terminal domain-containing protein n=1 Tax=Pedobacter rhodius TaxID=3004098 RepID=A0ABT4L0E9_9SPHI|nr:gliding motility-associated C-terminal domain-containing protein [Pedobacter sp. SJ11]MCZ4223573.1 gliding motility-associated C-terminal domain-containing protein [Pedobacter sp. SJ11]